MDPESVTFQPRDDLWRVQSEMLRVQQTQADLADRVSRLEESSRVKNVWGTSSPFPSVLGGTPQQVPLQQPTAEHFSSFDDQTSNLIGNLQLDADDEPRRIGATSRANSVRFDETANPGHWAHTSRSSLDLIPRSSSSMGGHALSERSYSHKSNGGQSSAGQSVHSATSGRANSLTGFGTTESPGLAPGLLILGPVPAIIRCWLTTSFKHNTMLYAAVCSGSYTSHIDARLVDVLGLESEIRMNEGMARKIKIAVYFPEAVPIPSSSRPSSPAPQLPSLNVDFTVIDDQVNHVSSKAIQIYIGSDVLRAHNADLLFSTNQLTLYDDDRTRQQVPLVRPEDEQTFNSLFTASGRPTSAYEPVGSDRSASAVPEPADEPMSTSTLVPTPERTLFHSDAELKPVATADLSERFSGERKIEPRPQLGLSTSRSDVREARDASPSSATSRSGPSSTIWTNWRREPDKASPNPLDWANVSKTPAPSYSRRDTGIKVLKPLKSTNRAGTGSRSQIPSPATVQSRFFDDGKRRESSPPLHPSRTASSQRSASGSITRDSAPSATKSGFANPIGGASAFAWLNNGGDK